LDNLLCNFGCWSSGMWPSGKRSLVISASTLSTSIRKRSRSPTTECVFLQVCRQSPLLQPATDAVSIPGDQGKADYHGAIVRPPFDPALGTPARGRRMHLVERIRFHDHSTALTERHHVAPSLHNKIPTGCRGAANVMEAKSLSKEVSSPPAIQLKSASVYGHCFPRIPGFVRQPSNRPFRVPLPPVR
jgi:hypothetical protein